MRKIMKIFFLAFILMLSVASFSSCGKGNQGENPNPGTETTDQKETIYKLAVESGYTGTYEEWLESIKGDYIELSVTSTHIVWKYASESVWRNLIELSKLSGLQGTAGSNGADGKDGVDGKTPEFRVNAGYLEWKYTTDTNWIKLYEITTNSNTSSGNTPQDKTEYVTVTFVTKFEFEKDVESVEDIKIVESVKKEVPVGNITEPTDILSEEETCYGWYYYDKYQGFVPWLFDAYYNSKDLVLYGVVGIEYDVIYLDENGEVYQVLPVLENEYAYNLGYEVKTEGRYFVGWSIDGKELFDFNTPINSNITLKPILNERSVGDINVYLNYNGKNGISYQKTESYYNTVDGKTYRQGDLLPTWNAFSQELDMVIADVAEYSTTHDNNTYEAVVAKNFMGANGAPIDLFYNSVPNIKKMASADMVVDLMPYLNDGQMPNFGKFLTENPEVLDMCATYDKEGQPHIYFTPYFDGYQQIERMFIMDTEMVERLLDVEGAGDYTAAIGQGKLEGNYYKPYMDAVYNYKDEVTLVQSVNDKDEVINVEVMQTTNIIKQQNVSLAIPTTTGKDLVAQFQAYLKEAYPSYSGKLSEIFTGVKAVYNPDDLVALMRVVKANPATATGIETCTEVTTFFPRGEAANRMENIFDLAQIWGLKGVDSESNNLYFDGTGKLNVVGGMQESYDALVLLNQLYNEGLIEKDFHFAGSRKSTYYLDKYFKNTSSDSGAGFMMYDYCASTTVGNKIDDNGIGTTTERRQGVYAGKDRMGIRPVLAPVTYWNTSYEAKNTDKLVTDAGFAVNREIKTLTRYYESNRALKANSWCIPKTAQNIENAIKLMDFLYSEEGANINNFGPKEYRGENSTDIIYGETVPTLSKELIDMYLASGTDFWSFMREYIGSTNGIGHVRSDALDMQVTNKYAQVGLSNVQKAIKLGVMTLATCKPASEYGWETSVPTNWQVSENVDTRYNYQDVANFWNASSTGVEGWKAVVVAPVGIDLNYVVVNGDVTFEDVISQKDAYNKYYLSVWANSINCVPEWLIKLQQE